MKQPPKKTVKSASDTTKIPTPYKTVYPAYKGKKGEMSTDLYSIVAKSKTRNGYGLTSPDTTKKKAMYNVNTVKPALNKRNSERIKEGKKPISQKQIFGDVNPDNNAFSSKGKSFKEAPLKIVKKKK